MALINLRNALMAGRRLPYDAELEYLESTGTQYIDTLVNVGSNLSVEITMANAGTPWTNTNPTGAILVSTSSQTRHHLNFSSSGINYYYGNISNPNIKTSYKPDNLVPFTFKVDSVNKIFTLGDYSTALPTYDFDAGLSYWLFGRNGTTPPYLGSLRICSAKLWNGNILVRDFIPVRKGTVGYLYDRVTRKLFGNAGTGDFVLGPDVVPVEYIESHGTEYIDTGVATSATARIETDFLLHDIYTQAVYGNRIDRTVGVFWGTSTTGLLYCNDGVHPVSPEFSPVAETIYKVVQQGNNIVVNGETYTTTGASDNAQTMLLFGRREEGSASRIINGRIFHHRIYDANATTLRSFRPVRVGTDATLWEGAMMDVLTRRIYRNQGTGAFGYGNDLKYPIPAE